MIMANVKSLMKSLGIKSGNEIEFEEYSDVRKSESENPKDPKFEYFKKKILDHLAELEKQENKAVSKSIDIEEWIQKANYPVGTVRTWNGQKFKKITPKKWARVYESESRGAKMAIAALRRKAAACKNSEELYQLCLAHKTRFLDKDKKPLPFMQEFSEYVSGLNDKKEPAPAQPAKKTAKKATSKTKKKEEPKVDVNKDGLKLHFESNNKDEELKELNKIAEKAGLSVVQDFNGRTQITNKKGDGVTVLKGDTVRLENGDFIIEKPYGGTVNVSKQLGGKSEEEEPKESESATSFKGSNLEKAIEKYESDKILKWFSLLLS